jgi:hypothetical protein
VFGRKHHRRHRVVARASVARRNQSTRPSIVAAAGSDDDEECVDGDEGKMHHRDCHPLSLRLDAREHIEPDDVAPAHDSMGGKRYPVPETSRVMCSQKPQSACGQNGEPVRLDNADHRRVLVKGLPNGPLPDA